MRLTSSKSRILKFENNWDDIVSIPALAEVASSCSQLHKQSYTKSPAFCKARCRLSALGVTSRQCSNRSLSGAMRTSRIHEHAAWGSSTMGGPGSAINPQRLQRENCHIAGNYCRRRYRLKAYFRLDACAWSI